MIRLQQLVQPKRIGGAGEPIGPNDLAVRGSGGPQNAGGVAAGSAQRVGASNDESIPRAERARIKWH